jgi:endothelin-converting enzyme
MTNEVSSTTHVPLLNYEDEDSLVGFSGSREDGMAETDSLEGHIITVVKPSNENYFIKIVKTPTFWLAVVIFILLLVCIVLGVRLSRSKKEFKTLALKENSVCLTQGCLDSAHYMSHAIDSTINPCEDFFQYSCGGWIKNNPIPDSKSFWGTFSSLWDSNVHVMKRLLTDDSIKNSSSTTIKLAKTFYDSCMNMDEINKRGARPLHEMIKGAGGWSVSKNSTGKVWKKSSFVFKEQLKKIHLQYRTSVFFSFVVEPDDKNSSSNIIQVGIRFLILFGSCN